MDYLTVMMTILYAILIMKDFILIIYYVNTIRKHIFATTILFLNNKKYIYIGLKK